MHKYTEDNFNDYSFPSGNNKLFYNVCQLFGAAFDLVRSLIITHVYGAKLPLFPYAPRQKKKKTNLNSRKKNLEQF